MQSIAGAAARAWLYSPYAKPGGLSCTSGVVEQEAKKQPEVLRLIGLSHGRAKLSRSTL